MSKQKFGSLVRVFDLETRIDRFTVIYLDRKIDSTMNRRDSDGKNGMFQARAMSDRPFDSKGFNVVCPAQLSKRLGRRIKLKELPSECRKLVASDLGVSPSALSR